MSQHFVHPDLCKRDGLCVRVCPIGILHQAEPDAAPSVRPGLDKDCVDCGHCAAICPHGAVDHGGFVGAELPRVRAELNLSREQLEQLLRSRRSIRRFRQEPVPRETLQSAIDLARWAPSGHNRQPVEWIVASGREQLRVLAGKVIDWMRSIRTSQPQLAQALYVDRVISGWEAGKDPVLRGAPHLAIAHAPKNDRTAGAASTIALAYLELAATATGLGACWAGYFQAATLSDPALQSAIGLPEGHQTFGALMLGHPQYRYQRIPPRKEARITWRD